VTDIGLGLFLG